MPETIFICWKEIEFEFIEWRYIGGGEHDPVMDEKTIIKKCRYSSENTPEMMKRAKAYIESNRPEGWIEVVEE